MTMLENERFIIRLRKHNKMHSFLLLEICIMLVRNTDGLLADMLCQEM